MVIEFERKIELTHEEFMGLYGQFDLPVSQVDLYFKVHRPTLRLRIEYQGNKALRSFACIKYYNKKRNNLREEIEKDIHTFLSFPLYKIHRLLKLPLVQKKRFNSLIEGVVCSLDQFKVGDSQYRYFLELESDSPTQGFDCGEYVQKIPTEYLFKKIIEENLGLAPRPWSKVKYTKAFLTTWLPGE